MALTRTTEVTKDTGFTKQTGLARIDRCIVAGRVAGYLGQRQGQVPDPVFSVNFVTSASSVVEGSFRITPPLDFS